MIDDDALSRAVAGGIITADQAEKLKALTGQPPVAASAAPLPDVDPDDERQRFVTGFADIFVTIGIALFVGALTEFSRSFGGGAIAWAGIGITAWLLAEYFTRRRRMALPSLVLLGLFAVSSLFGLMMIAFDILKLGFGYDSDPEMADTFAALWQGGPTRSAAFAIAGFLTVMLVALHYWRFRVPATIAAGVGALVLALAAFIQAVFPTAGSVHQGALFGAGLGVFALAMRYDASDIRRVTRRTDIAFWLHLLAAPLIVHTLLSLFLPDTGKMPTAGTAVLVLIVFAVLSLVAVIVDRRALLVSGLIYAGFAFGTLIHVYGQANMAIPITLLVLGAFILLLSAGWQPLRAVLLKPLPAAIRAKLPVRAVSA